MKKIFSIIIILVILMGFTSSVAFAEDPPPAEWIFPFERTEVEVQTGQEVVLATAWIACTKGQIQSFRTSAHLDYYLDGVQLFPNGEDLEIWSPTMGWEEFIWDDIRIGCISGNENKAYWVMFNYSLGSFDEPGDHTIYLDYYYDHPITDGYDGKDGVFDGIPDKYSGSRIDIVTVHVVEP